MKRDLQGHTVPIVIEGEELQAFVPNPLPPDPPIRPTADLTNISDSALIAMRLHNGVLSALEDHAPIAKLLSYLEAVLSCQIDDLPSNVVSMFNARMGCPIANSSIETQEALCYTLAQKEGFEHLEKGEMIDANFIRMVKFHLTPEAKTTVEMAFFEGVAIFVSYGIMASIEGVFHHGHRRNPACAVHVT